MNRKVSTIIVDDEPLARRAIRLLLKDFPDVEVAAECADGASAVEAIRNTAPDLVFLDVQMPVMNGFGVIESLGTGILPQIVFVTAYDRYALRAFEVHALDYLLKPFDDQRFEEALHRALTIIRTDRQAEMKSRLMRVLQEYRLRQLPNIGKGEVEVDRIAIKSHGRISFLPVPEIDWIEAADQYVLIHVRQQSHLIRESMNLMEENLPSTIFFRIHRSSLVNLQRVRELRSNNQGECEVILQDGTSLKVSRNRRSLLQEALKA